MVSTMAPLCLQAARCHQLGAFEAQTARIRVYGTLAGPPGHHAGPAGCLLCSGVRLQCWRQALPGNMSPNQAAVLPSTYTRRSHASEISAAKRCLTCEPFLRRHALPGALTALWVLQPTSSLLCRVRRTARPSCLAWLSKGRPHLYLGSMCCPSGLACMAGLLSAPPCAAAQPGCHFFPCSCTDVFNAHNTHHETKQRTPKAPERRLI